MNDCEIIMQGDDLFLIFEIMLDNEIGSPQNIDVLEIKVGNLVKYYGAKENSVLWNEEHKIFLFPLSQEETFLFKGPQEIQIRLKNESGVWGKVVGRKLIQFSSSKEIL